MTDTTPGAQTAYAKIYIGSEPFPTNLIWFRDLTAAAYAEVDWIEIEAPEDLGRIGDMAATTADKRTSRTGFDRVHVLKTSREPIDTTLVFALRGGATGQETLLAGGACGHPRDPPRATPEVEGPMIVTLPELRNFLGLTAGVAEEDDAMLAQFLAAAQQHVESWLGYKVADRYGAEDQEPLPEPLRVAVMQIASSWFERREHVSERQLHDVPFGARQILDAYRDRSFWA